MHTMYDKIPIAFQKVLHQIQSLHPPLLVNVVFEWPLLLLTAVTCVLYNMKYQ